MVLDLTRFGIPPKISLQLFVQLHFKGSLQSTIVEGRTHFSNRFISSAGSPLRRDLLGAWRMACRLPGSTPWPIRVPRTAGAASTARTWTSRRRNSPPKDRSSPASLILVRLFSRSGFVPYLIESYPYLIEIYFWNIGTRGDKRLLT